MTFNDFAGKLLDSSKVDWKFIDISLKGITWMHILIFFVSISAGLGKRLFKHNEASLSVLKISSIDFGFLSNWSRLTECLFKICILFFHISGSPFDISKFLMYLGLKKNHELLYKYRWYVVLTRLYNPKIEIYSLQVFFEKNKHICSNQLIPKNHTKELKMPHFLPLFGLHCIYFGQI